MSYYDFGPYISVAEKARRAEKMVAEMRKKGYTMRPIPAFSGKIAHTFWGKSWCENLERYADFAYRVGRGRSYVRHGCVCDLEIGEGYINALVNGSSLYKVRVTITTLAHDRWQEICARSAGQIASLLELLQGKISKEVMKVVCEPETGLFPAPAEIAFSCSCPDVASLCKHAAAVLYAVGRKLDDDPSLLFTLRGVDASELLSEENITVPDAAQDTAFEGTDLGNLFGIDMAEVAEEEPQADASVMTGEDIRALREKAQLSQREFAGELAVCLQTVRRWEGCTGPLRLRPATFQALCRFQERVHAQ